MSTPQGRRAELVNGLQALGLSATEQQVDALIAYADLLLRWNATYNLTAIREAQGVLTHHLLDSLAPLPHLPPDDAALCVLDVGSGGGLPGAVWAIMRPNWQVTCVDAVAKKMAFVTQVSAQLSLRNLRAVHSRLNLEKAAAGLSLAAYDLVTSRAFSSLQDFAALTKFHVKQRAAPGLPAPWLALKGKPPVEEMMVLTAARVVGEPQILHVPGLHEARCLVWLAPLGSSVSQ